MSKFIQRLTGYLPPSDFLENIEGRERYFHETINERHYQICFFLLVLFFIYCIIVYTFFSTLIPAYINIGIKVTLTLTVILLGLYFSLNLISKTNRHWRKKIKVFFDRCYSLIFIILILFFTYCVCYLFLFSKLSLSFKIPIYTALGLITTFSYCRCFYYYLCFTPKMRKKNQRKFYFQSYLGIKISPLFFTWILILMANIENEYFSKLRQTAITDKTFISWIIFGLFISFVLPLFLFCKPLRMSFTNALKKNSKNINSLYRNINNNLRGETCPHGTFCLNIIQIEGIMGSGYHDFLHYNTLLFQMTTSTPYMQYEFWAGLLINVVGLIFGIFTYLKFF